MKFKIQILIDDEQGPTQIEDIISLDKTNSHGYCAGLSLLESKQLLKTLQQTIVLRQAQEYTDSHRACPDCHKQRRIKGYHTIQYNTLFGVVVIPSVRLVQCQCSDSEIKTFSPLHEWLPEHNSPELQYLETKWASYMSFERTTSLLQDVLPVSQTQNAQTVRNHLRKVAKRQDSELEGEPSYLSVCGNDVAKLAKPDKPLTIGIDGGYVRSCKDKCTNFEVIVGKSFSKTKKPKRFGFVQSIDDHPQRRMLHLLNKQGMQANQQIIFLSDGADNVRDLQYIMHPESEHVLDWFHITMRFTVLNQFAKGLVKSDSEEGKEVLKNLESAKWYLWHGNVKKSLERLEDCYMTCDDEEIKYNNQKKMVQHLGDMSTYIENNYHLIPNYGEKWRYGETITSSFVESTVNEVVTKRMVKKRHGSKTALFG